MSSRDHKSGAITRRSFIKRTGLATGGLLWASWDNNWAAAVGATSSDTIVLRLVRDLDLMQVEMHFVRCKKQALNITTAIVPDGFGDSIVALRFPPQNLGEAIFDEVHKNKETEENDLLVSSANSGGLQKEGTNDPAAPVMSRLSGPSWLVFALPNEAVFPMNDIGDWFTELGRCKLKVPRGAVPPEQRGAGFKPEPPGLEETRLEVPFRLVISPEADTRAFFSTPNVEPDEDEFQELWQTSLESRQDIHPAPPPPDTPNLPGELQPPREIVLQARAIWSPDYMPEGEPPSSLYYPGFQPLSLHALTRHRLVKQMGDGDGWIDVEHLILTALGADANFHYASQKSVSQIIEEQLAAARLEAHGPVDPSAKPDSGTELRLWKHRIVIGRDVYFAEAFFGFLFPFAHPSIYVEITKRKAAAKQSSNSNADKILSNNLGFFLLKRRFILVQDPVKNFAGSDSPLGRGMPLKKMRLVTLRSPDLEAPTQTQADGGGFFFWPIDLNTGKPVNWELEGTDEHGEQAKTRTAQLFFASNIVKGHRAYSTFTTDQRTIGFDGSKVSFTRNLPSVHIDPPPGIGGQRPISIETDRGSARFFTQVRQQMRGVKAFDDIGHAISNALKEVPITVEVKRVEGELRSAVQQMQGWVDKRREFLPLLLDEFKERLERAEKMASQLATGAMTFQSSQVDDLVQNASEFADKAGAAATTVINGLQLVNGLLENKKLPDDVVNWVADKTQFLPEANSLKADAVNWVNSQMNQATAVANAFLQWKPKGGGASPFTPDDAKEYINRRITQQLDSLRALGSQAADNAELPKLSDLGSQYFHAFMESADVDIPALKDVLPDAPQRAIAMTEEYIAGGIESMRQGVFGRLASVIDTGQKLADGVKNGIAQPAAVIAGLSREIGAVVADGASKLKEMGQQLDKFDIASAIPDSKLFGVISLSSLLGEIGRGQMPKLQTVELPDKIERSWEWTAPLKESQDFGILTVKFTNHESSRLAIYSKSTLTLPTAKNPGTRPSADVKLRGWLGAWNDQEKTFEEQINRGKKTPGESDVRVRLNLLQLIEVKFAYIEFGAHYTEGSPFSPKLDPKFVGVDFLGPLQFVATLQSFLKSLGGGLNIDLQATYIAINSEVQLPPVSCGAFSLKCLRLEYGLRLPFDGSPLQFTFAFASFEKPFELSVMGFSGRGYFSAAIGTDGSRDLEGALEFGGSLSFDVGVADGGLYVMAGIHFSITQNETTLGGYLRAGGTLNVLGLIHASVEFMLMVAYKDSPGSSVLYGTCTITVSIDMGFYSQHVDISMEKTIAGSDKKQTPDQAALAANLAAGLPLTALAETYSDHVLGGHGGDRPKPFHLHADPLKPPVPAHVSSDTTASTGRPYIGRGRGQGQFESFSKWRDMYWKHVAN